MGFKIPGTSGRAVPPQEAEPNAAGAAHPPGRARGADGAAGQVPRGIASRLFGRPREKLADWAKMGGPEEMRETAEARIREARKLGDEDFKYESADCDLRRLGLTSLPIESLMKIDPRCKILIDLDKLTPHAREALIARVSHPRYSGPTFGPEPLTAEQRESEAKEAAAQDARNRQYAAEDQARDAARAARAARAGQHNRAGAAGGAHPGPRPQPGPQAGPRRPAAAAASPARGPAGGKVNVGSLTSLAAAKQAVDTLKANGFDPAKLRELKADIREYGNFGDLNKGENWFHKKYGAHFDSPISEPNALINYSRMVMLIK